ncbi:hypothetical protein Gotri_025723 [Gossypium trilobum]|uniref:Uncharacterized protein n=1 Tax=Gossypium trilobum TaxID=34281 RepID=A0A7J9FRR2_9ROSI|nr:hypothetical protein [Gossypium trilobum]
MKRLAVGPMTTPEYNEWWVKRINELEIIKQDFEWRNVELKKKIEQIEEEKMNLRLDADV